MATIFTKIILGEIPCFKVAEDKQFLAFLDIRPVVFGHTLIIPKKEVDYYFDLQDDEIAAINVFAKKVAHVLKEEVPCLRIGVMVAGLEVPHAHVHLIPMNAISDLSFSNPRPEFPVDEMKALADKLYARLNA
jgi:histidine triad (HIT) family protein